MILKHTHKPMSMQKYGTPNKIPDFREINVPYGQEFH